MDKFKSSICFSCCFRTNDVDPLAQDSHPPSSMIRNSSTWIRSKAAQELPELRDKCKGFLSRMGKSGHSRRHSTDFRYDALSYALNFDEGPDFDDDGEISPSEFKYRSFSSRLPPSPPTTAPPVPAKEVACS